MGSGNYECSLWLEIGPPSGGSLTVTLHNTTQGATYRLWSTTNLNSPTWTLQETLKGQDEQTPSSPISISGDAAKFFKADQRGYEVGTQFEGIGQLEAGSTVPDSMGAAGPSHFVEIVNWRIVVYDKGTGTRIPGEEMTLTEFFGGQHVFDPRVLYDHASKAWVACALEFNSKSVMLAIKNHTNAVPLTGWSKYTISIAYQSSLPDFTTLGVDKNGVYVTALQRHIDQGTSEDINDAQSIIAIKKPEIYAGNLIYTQFTIDSNPAELKVRTIQPAVNFDDPPAGGYAYLVAKGPAEHGSPYRGGKLYYRAIQWNANGVAELTHPSWQEVVAPPPETYQDYFDLDDGTVRAPQLGDPQGGPSVINLNFSGSRLMMAVIRDNTLWTCQHIGFDGPEGTYGSDDTTGGEVDRTGVQWIRLNLAHVGQGLAYANHGRIFDNAVEPAQPFWYYFPSLMVNAAGDAVMGFSGASSQTHIGAFCSWPTGTCVADEPPILIHSGQGHLSADHRFGDYSATSLDPVDGISFWTVQEFAKDESVAPAEAWGTWIAKLAPEP